MPKDNTEKFDVEKLIELFQQFNKENYDLVDRLFILLQPYYTYNPEVNPNSPIPPKLLHIIYRLSDFIPKEQRCSTPVYPYESGSLIQSPYNGPNAPWDSLEDWRKKWESANNGIIPEIAKLLPSEVYTPLLNEANRNTKQ